MSLANTTTGKSIEIPVINICHASTSTAISSGTDHKATVLLSGAHVACSQTDAMGLSISLSASPPQQKFTRNLREIRLEREHMRHPFEQNATAVQTI